MKLAEKFVHYARGHPLALKILGVELNKRNMDHWKSEAEDTRRKSQPHQDWKCLQSEL